MDGNATSRLGKTAFLDVGAHMGQTAEVVLGPLFLFDKVISIEPDPACVVALKGRFRREIEQGRYEVIEGAMGQRNGEKRLFGSNAGGGATTLDTSAEQASGGVVLCREYDIAELLQDLGGKGYTIFLKLNCEARKSESSTGSAIRGQENSSAG